MPHWFYKSSQKTCTFPFRRYNPKAGLIHHPEDYPFARETHLHSVRSLCKVQCLCWTWLKTARQCSKGGQGSQSGLRQTQAGYQQWATILGFSFFFFGAESDKQQEQETTITRQKGKQDQLEFLCFAKGDNWE